MIRSDHLRTHPTVFRAMTGLDVSPTLVSQITADLDAEVASWRIRTTYPQAKVPLCIAHLVRAALRYVSDTDSRAVATGR